MGLSVRKWAIVMGREQTRRQSPQLRNTRIRQKFHVRITRQYCNVINYKIKNVKETSGSDIYTSIH